MGKKIKRRKIYILIVSLLVAIMLPILNTQKIQASDDPKNMTDVAANFSNYGSEFASDKSAYKYFDKVGDAWNYFGPGGKSVLGNATKGTNVATFDALAKGLYSASDSSMKTAGLFSYAMQQSGLDHPLSGQMSGITKGGRFIGAWLTVAILSIMFAANTLLEAAFSLFRWINPFTAIQYLAENKDLVAGNPNSLWKPILDVIRPAYHALGNIIWVFAIISFMLAITLALTRHSLVGDGQGKKRLQKDSIGHAIGAAGWKLLRRFLIYAAAPIIIGVLANDLLNDINDTGNLVDTVGYAQIYGNYLDFSNWAQNSRLALPSGSGLNQDGNVAFSRKYILALNADGANNKAAQAAQAGDSAKKGMSNKDKLDLYNRTTHFLLGTYASIAAYDGTTWESYVVSTFKHQAANANDKEAIKSPIIHFKFNDGKPNDWNKKDYSHYDGDGTASNDAKLEQNPYLSDYSMDYSNGEYHSNGGKAGSPASLGSSKNAGLSTLGLFNYLNTYTTGSGLQYTKPTSFLGFTGVNQHASAGFVGRGLLFISSYLLMNVMMLVCALILIFAAFIVVQGAITGIPRMLVYAFELATLRWEGFVAVFKEFIGIYARLIMAVLVVNIFTGTVSSVFDKLDSLLITGKGAAFSTFWMPFQVNTNILAFVRLLEAAAILMLLSLMIKSWWDILRLIKTIVDKLMAFVGGASGKGGAGQPKAPKMGKPNMGQNSPRTDNGGNQQAGLDSDNTFAAMNDKRKDRNNDKNAKNMGMGKAIKHQAGMAALAGMDALGNSKAGQMVKSGAGKLAATLGGSKLGQAFGLQGRGDGTASLEKFGKLARQGAANLADPLQANNSADATMTDQEKQNDDAKHEQEQSDATDNATQEADRQKEMQAMQNEEENQKANNLAQEVTPEGKVKKAEDTAQALDTAQKSLQNLQGTDTGAKKARETLGNNLAAYQEKAKEQIADNQAQDKKAQANVEAAKEKVQQKETSAQKAQDQVKQLEKQSQSSNQSSNKVEAQKALHQLPQAQKVADQKKAELQNAKQGLAKMQDVQKKMSQAHNTQLRSEMMARTGKDIGRHGENLEHKSKADQQKAQRSQFTAQTGKKANNVQRADKAMLDKAQQAKKEAGRVLANPLTNASEKADARKTLQDANVVTETGYEYGQFSKAGQQGQMPQYENASADEIHEAQANSGENHLIATTGYGIKETAQTAPAVMKAYGEQVKKAQEIVNTGNVVENGQSVPASEVQMQEAQELVNASPQQQIAAVQTQMINTTAAVTRQAENYGAQFVPQNASASEKAEIMQTKAQEYYRKPEVMQTMQSAGLVQKGASPQVVRQQIDQMQTLGNQTRVAMKASMAPIKRQMALGGFNSSNQIDGRQQRIIIKKAAVSGVNSMSANREWVDKQHFNKMNYGKAEKVINVLAKANASGNRTNIQKARIIARKNGIANSIINDTNKQQSVLNEIKNMREKVTNDAINRSTTASMLG